MCEPTTMAAIGAFTTMFEIAQNNSQAKYMIESARNAAVADYNLLELQGKQINQQVDLEQMERQKQAARERSRLLTAMGAAGVSGNTALRQISNTFLQESYDTGIMEQNRENSLLQNQAQVEKVYATQKSRINEANSQMINPLLGSLMIATSGVSGLSTGANLSKTFTGSPGNLPDLFNYINK